MLSIGYSGRSGAWRGVLRDDSGAVIAECGHEHPNRDNASMDKTAAVPCMRQAVKAALMPGYRKFCNVETVQRADELADLINSRPVRCHRQVITAS